MSWSTGDLDTIECHRLLNFTGDNPFFYRFYPFKIRIERVQIEMSIALIYNRVVG